jgi:hypothetical protein
VLEPSGEAREALATDYAHIADQGRLPEGAEPFEELIE